MVRNTLNVPRSLFVGFDSIFEDLERIHSSARNGANNYPPHNIVKIDEEKFLIELAGAGFSEDDFEIELKDGILKIRAEKAQLLQEHRDDVKRALTRKHQISDAMGHSLRCSLSFL